MWGPSVRIIECFVREIVSHRMRCIFPGAASHRFLSEYCVSDGVYITLWHYLTALEDCPG